MAFFYFLLFFSVFFFFLSFLFIVRLCFVCEAGEAACNQRAQNDWTAHQPNAPIPSFLDPVRSYHGDECHSSCRRVQRLCQQHQENRLDLVLVLKNGNKATNKNNNKLKSKIHQRGRTVTCNATWRLPAAGLAIARHMHGISTHQRHRQRSRQPTRQRAHTETSKAPPPFSRQPIRSFYGTNINSEKNEHCNGRHTRKTRGCQETLHCRSTHQSTPLSPSRVSVAFVDTPKSL